MKNTQLQIELQTKLHAKRPHTEDKLQTKLHYETAKIIAEYTDYKE